MNEHADEKAMVAQCFDCGMDYESPRWADVVIPDDDWKAIAPTDHGGGLLCFACMNARLVTLGRNDVPALITSGPMAGPVAPPESERLVALHSELKLALYRAGVKSLEASMDERRAQKFYNRCGEYAKAALITDQLLADCLTRISGERELIARSESRPDGSIPDDVARAEVAELDALLKRIKAAIESAG